MAVVLCSCPLVLVKLAPASARRATMLLVVLLCSAAMIASLEPHEAIALGALRHDLPDEVEITTKDRLEAMRTARAERKRAARGAVR